MSNNIVPFLFEDKEVRFVGTAINPWWIASDICAVLELQQPDKAVKRLDDDEKKLADRETLQSINNTGSSDLSFSTNPLVWLINESGLYSLVLTSRKPQAKRFKKWLTSIVLPEIRRTGGYGVEALQQENAELKAILNGLFDQLDTTNFHRSINELKQVCGIRSIAHLQKKSQEYLTEGEDYVIDHGEIKYSNAVYTALLISHRSTDGIDCSQVPEIIVLSRDCFIRVVEKLRNTLLPKRRWLPLPYVQLSFDFKFGDRNY